MWDIFASESSDNLTAIEQCLLKIEEYGEDSETIDSLYRSLHTFKGNARLMGLSNIESIAHYSEDIVGLIRDNGIKINSDLISLLLIVLDYLRNFLNIVISSESDIDYEKTKELLDLLQDKYNFYSNDKNNQTKDILKDPNVFHLKEQDDFSDEMFLYLYINTIESEYNNIISKINNSKFDDVKDDINTILQVWYNSTEKMGFQDLLNKINLIYQEFLLGSSNNLIKMINEFIHEINNLKQQTNVDINSDENIKFSEIIEKDLTNIISYLENIDENNNIDCSSETLQSINNIKNLSKDNYINLYNLIIELENIILNNRKEIDLFLLQYNLFNELIKIEDLNSNKYPFEEKMPSKINILFRQWHVNKIQIDLFKLQNEINSKNNLDFNIIIKLLDHIYHTFVFYNSKEICKLVLVIKDHISRVIEDNLILSDYLKDKIELFISILNKYLNDQNNYSDLEIVDLIYELNEYSLEKNNNKFVKLIDLPSEFLEIITKDNIDLINKSYNENKNFYILKANIDIDEKTAINFHNWLNKQALITSITLHDFANEFEFLIASKSSIEVLEEDLKIILPNFIIKKINLRENNNDNVNNFNIEETLNVSESKNKYESSNSNDYKSLQKEANYKELKNSDSQMYTDSIYLRVHNKKINIIMDLVGEIGLVAGSLITNPDILKLNSTEIQTSSQNLESLIRELQGETSSLRLISVSNLFKQMNRLTRDLSKETGKKIKFEIFGEDTEIDKIAVDKLYDPLVHIIRNCVDHGIESEEERISKNKSSIGNIKLKAIQQSNEIIIMISDDGRGLNKEKIYQKAKEKGLIKNEQIDDKSIYNYIFHPGFSTADKITDLSGRGVGMDIVQNTVSELRGRISIETEKDAGTKIMIHLPLTMAFIEAMIVRIEDSLYAIPITYIKEVFKGSKKDIHKISSDKDMVIKIRDEIIPMIWLQEVFKEESKNTYNEEIVIVINATKGLIALPVDELIGNQQITLKPLRGLLKDIKSGAGYGILSNGDIVIVIDVERLHDFKYTSI